MRILRNVKILKKHESIKSNPNLIPIFQDEVHFQIQTSISFGWFKRGSNPTVKSFPGRQKVSYSGFVNPTTGALFVTKPEVFNYTTTIESIRVFLKEHCPPKDKKYVIIMDNAPWHKKAYRLVVTENNEEYADIRKYASFLLLPPYSPDLNPIERVWRITRRENTHNHFFKSKEVLENTVDEAFAAFSEPNTKLQTLCRA